MDRNSRSSSKTGFKKKAYKTEISIGDSKNPERYQSTRGFDKNTTKLSVVQEKKYRHFLIRKRKLLSEISAGFREEDRRPLSPTS